VRREAISGSCVREGLCLFDFEDNAHTMMSTTRGLITQWSKQGVCAEDGLLVQKTTLHSSRLK
jgi:hypothetical protein